MDILEFLSSEEEQNYNESQQAKSSYNARESISTDLSNIVKTKHIKKKYQPIQDCGKTIRYEDDPNQYRKARKKIQNRQSATRVRGRKKNAFGNLQQEVEYLRKVNSELLLNNAKLQTQNSGLKEQIIFLRGIIKPDNKIDPIDKYLQPISTQNSSGGSPEHQSTYGQSDCLFIDEEPQWLRLPSSSSIGRGNWLNLTIFTIIVVIMVIPSEKNVIAIGKQTSETMQVSWLQSLLEILKIGTKFGLVIAYVLYSLNFIYHFYFIRKVKKV